MWTTIAFLLAGIIGTAASVANTRSTNQQNADINAANNAFNAQQAELQREFERTMDETKYQRAAADMRAAGINPVLASGASLGQLRGSAASAASPLSMLPADLSTLISMTRSPMDVAQVKNIEADADLKRAQAVKVESETSGVDLENAWKQRTLEARVESENLTNELTRARMKEIDAKIDDVEASIRLKEKQASTEEAKAEAAQASAILSRANAYKITAMLPYEKLYTEAATQAQKASASLSLVNADKQH